MRARGMCPVYGSSPLARGLHRHDEGVDPHGGIIPARAGFTRRARSAGRRRPDHPRSRGVYGSARHGGGGDQGSSPLARGLPKVAGSKRWHDGIIPARAGFTLRLAAAALAARDHPRSRGVYPHPPPPRSVPAGSSPLARGLRSRAPGSCAGRRIIPARAGFTCGWGRSAAPRRDHPRSRGVYRGAAGGRARPAGSSPLARGLHDLRIATDEEDRIIPARAGFTRPSRAEAVCPADHPRSRGVYLGQASWEATQEGSSPLARGLPGAGELGGDAGGIIPARAGFTAPQTAPQAAGGGGSSPLARGLLTTTARLPGCPGIIPARAGFTEEPQEGERLMEDHPRSRGVYRAG